METAGSLTAVPGWGGILMGASALADGFRYRLGCRLEDLVVCQPGLGEAFLALSIGGWATLLQKAKAAELLRCSYGPGRKFALNLLPPMFAGDS